MLVQDPHEAAHGDMPRAVIETGLADVVPPVRKLVERLAELARSKERFSGLVRAAKESNPIGLDEEVALRAIFDLLFAASGHDFSFRRSSSSAVVRA